MNPSAGPPDESLETALRHVTDAIPGASPKQRAFLYRRAGDLCVSMGQTPKALGWYGRAVDQSLELADAEGATQLCRLIIYVQPEAVRARCTLTWIAIGTGDWGGAGDQLGAYVEAAVRGRQATLTAQQLEWMFEATPDPGLRSRLVLEMTNLGESARAAALAERVRREPPPTLGRELRWARVLDATIGAKAVAARAAAAAS